MIKVSELRIGNFVLYLDELYIVDGLKFEENASKYRIAFKTIDGRLRSAKIENWINPIPLTPEILEKCGLKKFNNAWVPLNYNEQEYNKWRFTVWDWGEDWDDGRFKYNSAEFDVTISSLHQLQNLYFALTGEELNVQVSDTTMPNSTT